MIYFSVKLKIRNGLLFIPSEAGGCYDNDSRSYMTGVVDVIVMSVIVRGTVASFIQFPIPVMNPRKFMSLNQ